MGRRYSQIKRGAEYNTALDNYITYLRSIETRPTKRVQGGTRGARRQTSPAAVRPFGKELATGTFASVRVGQDSLTELTSALSTRLLTGVSQIAAAARWVRPNLNLLRSQTNEFLASFVAQVTILEYAISGKVNAKNLDAEGTAIAVFALADQLQARHPGLAEKYGWAKLADVQTFTNAVLGASQATRPDGLLGCIKPNGRNLRKRACLWFWVGLARG